MNNRSWLIITLIIACLIGGMLVYFAHFDSKDIKQKINTENAKAQNKLDSLLVNMNRLTHSEPLNQEILILRDEAYNFKLKIEQKQNEQKEVIENLYLAHIKNWMWVTAFIIAIMVFTGLDFNVKNFIKTQLTKMVDKDLDKIVEQRYGDLIEEIKLKKKVKILVINEKDTAIPDIFEKLLKEFPNKVNQDIDDLDDLYSKINYSTQFDLVILEDMVTDKRWLTNPRDKAENNQNEKNNKLLLDFCKNVSPKTAILYYGDGILNKENIKNTDIEQFISFANSPATLLQNITNLIKLHSLQ